jgi:hypothetical protein
MNERSDPIALAERQVAEARTAALAEFEAARARVRRRVVSPVVIGGVLLGAVALGYLAFAHGKRRRRGDPGNPDAWVLAAKTVRVLVPLLMAFASVTRSARAHRAEISGTAR